jgi:Collagen triple helix repeat (20 copies)
MKKFQVPVLGGMRKMILPPSTTPGTTIAELGASTISLAQLSALVTAQQAAQANNGGGNIGDGTEAILVAGPGLAGGGPMLGNVNLRLTIPPALIAEDGIDGDPGLQGIQGVAGAKGVAGAPGFALFAEDGIDGDPGMQGLQGLQGLQGIQGIPGVSGTGSSVAVSMLFQDDTVDNDAFGILPMPPPQVLKVITANSLPISLIQDDVQAEELLPHSSPNSTGPLDVNGPLNVNGAVTLIPTSSTGLTVNAVNAPNDAALVLLGNATIGQSKGLRISAGTNTVDFALNVTNLGDSVTYLTAFGDGSVVVGNIVNPGTGAGSLTAAGAVAIQGATPAVVAATTALGTTTTATVITTASGIALPTLASTFWVVNVNGVKYGIPCFAL